MQRVIGALCKHCVNGNQILHLTNLGRQDDLVAAKADFFCKICRNQRRLNNGFTHDFLRAQRRTLSLIAIHQRGQQFLIERSPVNADTDRLVITDRHFNDIGELLGLSCP